MKIFAILLFLIASSIVSFYLGSIYGQGKVLRSKRYEVLTPLAFSSINGDQQASQIPVGTTLYEYRTFGETSNYALFIEMKETTPLKEIQRKNDLELIPASVYPLRTVETPRQ